MLPRKRVLIVNCYFDDSREPIQRRSKIPQAVGPLYLAGFFNRKFCDIRCYTELASGPLEDEQILGWADMLVLTGLTNAFDRMLHLTAYARSKNSKVIVAAGGPAVRILRLLAHRFFDYCCTGDIEEIRDVIADAFGSAYIADEFIPRYDLGYWLGSLGYIESSRYCNFRCSFCSLTGEGRSYQAYEADYIFRQIAALGRKRRILFIDNNFYGSDRANFRARIEIINEMRRERRFQTWSALVTNDFYSKEENLVLVKDSGCELLFTGVESFERRWLDTVSKLQNSSTAQVPLIQKCLDSGIVFSYGLMLDVVARSVDELRSELEFVLNTPAIPLPSFLTLAIPILGTPYFFHSLRARRILPNTKLRDMDGTTLLQKPLDPVEKVVALLRDLETLNGYQLSALRHSLEFLKLYGSKLNAEQLSIAVGQGLLLCAPRFSSSFTGSGWLTRRKKRTYVSTTEPIDRMYVPAFRIDSRFERYFRPTMVTDNSGDLHEDLISSGLFNLHNTAGDSETSI